MPLRPWVRSHVRLLAVPGPDLSTDPTRRHRQCTARDHGAPTLDLATLSARQYRPTRRPTLEDAVKVHYVVTAHRDPAQLVDLVAALHAPSTSVVVHVDGGVDQTPFATPETLARATFVTDRVKVRWGGWTVAEGVVKGMEALEARVEDDDYVVVLSGDSYPLATQDAVRTVLQRNAGAEFISSVPFPAPGIKKDEKRVSTLFWEADARKGVRNPLVRLVNRLEIPRDWRKAYGDYRPLCGPSWFALTGATTRWVLAEMHRNPGFVNFTKNTRNASEQFFQTLVGASPAAGRERRHLMYVDWSRGESWPATIGPEHVERFVGSPTMEFPHASYGVGPVLFARKVPSGGPDGIAAQLRERVWPHWDQILAAPAS